MKDIDSRHFINTNFKAIKAHNKLGGIYIHSVSKTAQL